MPVTHGRSLRYTVARKTGRGAQGVRLIQTDGGDRVTSVSLLVASSA